MMTEDIKCCDVASVGNYIVIQRQNYSKLHKMTMKGLVMLGKDQIELSAIVGKPLWTTYKMIQKRNGKRLFELSACNNNTENFVEQLMTQDICGEDNRNIFDDGRSQALSTEEIVNLRDSGMSGHAIVGQLIENSKTFKDKTEYSQEKYLKKKEKKYFEYVTIRKPTIRLLAQILYRQDPAKIMGLRTDTLGQLNTWVGVQAGGTYLLYESGCQGLAAASMLNAVATTGTLIHIHPGNVPQKQAILAMNFTPNQMRCLISVNIYSLLRKVLQQDSTSGNGLAETKCATEQSLATSAIEVSKCNSESSKTETEVEVCVSEQSLVINSTDNNSDTGVVACKTDSEVNSDRKDEEDITISLKRKLPAADEYVPKKPRWELETEKAADLLLTQKADGLMVVAREHPTNIIKALLPHVAPSRPIAVFCPCREPLLELYLYLKSRSDVVAVRVTETFLRTHQILPSRTHPDILMSGGGGYILTATVVEAT